MEWICCMDSPILDALNLAHHPRWIEVDDVNEKLFLMCSNCGECVYCSFGDEPQTCPNCRADMKEKDNDEKI